MRAIRVSPVVGEIIAGVVLGPHVLDIVPYADESHGLPSIFSLAGNVGVTLMIMQSGTHMEFEKLRHVGMRAVGVAICGTIAPIVVSMFVMMFVGEGIFPNGVAAGIALAPTSVGIAVKLLTDSKQLNADYGQTILAAAFIDDVLSLVALVVLKTLAAGDADVFSISWPVVAAFGFLGIGALLASRPFPHVVNNLLERLPESPGASMQPRDEFQLMLMLVTLVGCGYIGHLIGSHLLGAFVAGLLFMHVARSSIVWGRQLKRVSSWLVRLFFAATVAFSIPTEVLFSVDAFWKGCILTVVGCILPKLCSGLFAGRRDAKVVGWAMVPRGEFAYFVAATATATKLSSSTTGEFLLSPESYSVLLWALLASTFIAPLAFEWQLGKHLKTYTRPRSASIGRSERFSIRVEAVRRPGLLAEIITVLAYQSLEVREAVVETDDSVDVFTFTVQLRKSHHSGQVDDEKLIEIRHEILSAVNDTSAQVVCGPSETVDITMLEIQMTCQHHPEMLSEITAVLQRLELEIVMATCHGTIDGYDVEVLYVENKGRPGSSINSGKRLDCRDGLHDLIANLGIKGEVMVKAPHPSQVPSHTVVPNRAIAECYDGLLEVAVDSGDHRQSTQTVHDIAAAISEMGLDIVTADVESGQRNVAQFYVRPRAMNPLGSTVSRVREALNKTATEGQCQINVSFAGSGATVRAKAAAMAARAAIARASFEDRSSSDSDSQSSYSEDETKTDPGATSSGQVVVSVPDITSPNSRAVPEDTRLVVQEVSDCDVTPAAPTSASEAPADTSETPTAEAKGTVADGTPVEDTLAATDAETSADV